jgi:hypothetical protein
MKNKAERFLNMSIALYLVALAVAILELKYWNLFIISGIACTFISVYYIIKEKTPDGN